MTTLRQLKNITIIYQSSLDGSEGIRSSRVRVKRHHFSCLVRATSPCNIAERRRHDGCSTTANDKTGQAAHPGLRQQMPLVQWLHQFAVPMVVAGRCRA